MRLRYLQSVFYKGSYNFPHRQIKVVPVSYTHLAKDPSVKGYNDLDELFADLKR